MAPDYVKIVNKKQPSITMAPSLLTQLINGLEFKAKFSKNKVLMYYYYDYHKYGIHIRRRYDALEAYLSMHKFKESLQGFKGNHTDFCFSEYFETIGYLCELIKCHPLETYIMKMENALNIDVDESAIFYINSVKSFKYTTEFIPMISNHKKYGVKCFLSEYNIKFYDKTFESLFNQGLLIPNRNILRFETQYKRNKPFKKTVQTLQDLLDKNKVYCLGKQLLKKFNQVHFDEVYHSDDLTAQERQLIYAGVSANFWNNEIAIDKEFARKLRAEYRYIQRYLRQPKIGNVSTKLYLKDKIESKIEKLIEG